VSDVSLPGLVDVVPPELTAAAGPLQQAGQLLRGLAEDRPGLERLAAGSPNPAVRRALQAYIETVELVVWELGGDANNLAHLLRLAAQEYTANEREQQRRFAAVTAAQTGQGSS
jgi:hypothetical protein